MIRILLSVAVIVTVLETIALPQEVVSDSTGTPTLWDKYVHSSVVLCAMTTSGTSVASSPVDLFKKHCQQLAPECRSNATMASLLSRIQVYFSDISGRAGARIEQTRQDRRIHSTDGLVDDVWMSVTAAPCSPSLAGEFFRNQTPPGYSGYLTKLSNLPLASRATSDGAKVLAHVVFCVGSDGQIAVQLCLIPLSKASVSSCPVSILPSDFLSPVETTALKAKSTISLKAVPEAAPTTNRLLATGDFAMTVSNFVVFLHLPKGSNATSTGLNTVPLDSVLLNADDVLGLSGQLVSLGRVLPNRASVLRTVDIGPDSEFERSLSRQFSGSVWDWMTGESKSTGWKFSVVVLWTPRVFQEPARKKLFQEWEAMYTECIADVAAKKPSANQEARINEAMRVAGDRLVRKYCIAGFVMTNVVQEGLQNNWGNVLRK
jgi:hypothetical protein